MFVAYGHKQIYCPGMLLLNVVVFCTKIRVEWRKNDAKIWFFGWVMPDFVWTFAPGSRKLNKIRGTKSKIVPCDEDNFWTRTPFDLK